MGAPIISAASVVEALPEIASESQSSQAVPGKRPFRRRGPSAWFERLFIIVGLIVVMGAVLQLVSAPASESGSGAEGYKLIQIATSLIYIVTLVLMAPRLGQLLALLRRSKAMMLLVGLSFLSWTWSIDPGLTLRRSTALLGTTMFAAYIVLRFDVEEFVRLLGRALLAVAVLSVLFVVAFPDLGTQASLEGAWRGVFAHKNELGRAMGLALPVLLLLRLESRRPVSRRVWEAGWILCLLLLAASGSRTGWVLGLTGILMAGIVRALRRSPSLAAASAWLLIVVVGGTGAVIANLNSEEIGTATLAESLGRSSTLTGRTVLWEVVQEQVALRPWLGYGYKAYWDASEGPGREVVPQRVGWRPTDAHNGYLDLWLDLGVAGVAVFALAITSLVVRILTSFRRMRPIAAGFLPMALVYVSVMNITESVLLYRNSIWWVVLVLIQFYSMRASSFEEERRSAGLVMRVPQRRSVRVSTGLMS